MVRVGRMIHGQTVYLPKKILIPETAVLNLVRDRDLNGTDRGNLYAGYLIRLVCVDFRSRRRH